MRNGMAHGRVAGVAAAVLAVATLTVVTGSSGFATPQADIAQVQAQVRDLEMQAAAAHEEAERAAVELQAVRGELAGVQARLGRERDALQDSESVVADLARGLYASGGVDPTLQVLMADDPVEFLAQSAVLSQLAASQAAEIRKAQTARLRLAQTEAEAADRQGQAEVLEERMAQASAQVDERLEQARGVLAGLREEERQRLASLQAQRRQEQQEQARIAAAALATATPTGGSGAPGESPGSASSGPGSGSSADGGGFSGGSRAQQAVQYALAQVGEPYSYSARPPDSWDCSKLTAAAWAQAGVGLTALSYTQWDQTKRVPVSDIQPGDLVFYFGSGAHHVAIYVGNGKMVSASNPSDGVELIDFLGPWYNERFSGVGRVIG